MQALYFFLTNSSEIVTFINCFRCIEVNFFSLEISDIIKLPDFFPLVKLFGGDGRNILGRVSNIALPM